MKIVTGATGQAHVTAADDGALHAVLFDKMYDPSTEKVSTTADTYVLPIGDVLEAETISASKIRIKSGDIMMQGRHGRIPHGTYDELTIENGTTGYYRSDLIVCHYENNDGVESMKLKVVKGTPTTGTAKDPTYTTGNILVGDAEVDYPLYRVRLSGINISQIDKVFSLWTPSATHSHTMNQIQGELPLDRTSGNLSLNRTSGNLSLYRTIGNLPLNRTSGNLDVTRVAGSWPLDRTSGVLSVSAGGTGVSTRGEMFERVEFITDNVSVKAGTAIEISINISSKTNAGYIPLGFIGSYMSNASSSGVNVSNMALYGMYISDSGTAVLKAKNTGSSEAKVKAVAKIVFVKP